MNLPLIDLKKIVDIDTSNHQNIELCFKVLSKIANAYGLEFLQYNEKILLISNQNINLELDYCAILTHIDVVGVNSELNPNAFNLDTNQQYLYGRGVIDNKGSVISCLHALKNKSKNTLLPWVLVIGSEEETSMNDIKEFFANEKEPCISFTPDGLFDVCVSEPHIITCDFLMPNIKQEVFETQCLDYNVVCGNLNYNGSTYSGKATHISDIDNSSNALYLIPNIANQDLKNLISVVCNNRIPTINEEFYNTFNIGFINSNDKVIKIGIDIRIDAKLDIDCEFKRIKTYLEENFNGVLNIAKVYLKGYNHTSSNYFNEYSKDKKIYCAKGGTYARMLNNCFVIGPQDEPDICNGPHSNEERILKKDFLNWVPRFEKVINELELIVSKQKLIRKDGNGSN